MIFTAIGCLSLSSLAFELLITRFFSIAHWNHLSFLAVGVAMFGYAAGGTLHSLLGDRFASAWTERPRPFFAWLLLAGSVTTIGSFLIVRALPLDYLRFPLDPWQPVYLLLTCVVVSCPFLVSGLACCAGYANLPDRSGAISCASFLGGAAGAVAPAILLPALAEGGCVAAAALIPLVPVLVFASGRVPRATAAILSVGLVALLSWSSSSFLRVEPSSYKTLPLLLQAPGTRVISRQSGLRGRLEEVKGPTIRFAPGLSLAFTHSLPAQTGLIVDGDSLNVLYNLRPPGALEFAPWTHSFAVHAMAGRDVGPDAGSLVLQADGGLALACAIAAGSRPIVLVTEDPRMARKMAQWYRAAPVSVIADNPRSFLAATKQMFSTIVIEDWGPSIPGMASLSEDALLTENAIRACWARLAEGGALAVARRLVLPPSDSLRLFATMLDALRRQGQEDPPAHLAVIRSWDSCSIIAARDPILGDELGRLKAFAQAKGFDLDYYPGMNPTEANRFSRYDRPIFAEAYHAIIQDPGLIARQDLDIAPQSDDRPFPSHFVKWARVSDFYRSTGQRIYTLLLTGEIVSGVALIEAVILSAALVALTFFLGRGLHGKGGRGSITTFIIVGMGGIGFMGTEMFAIDSLAPLFPSPSMALSIALGGLLSFSALGGLASERFSRRMLRSVLLANAAAIIVLGVLSPWILERALPLRLASRIAAALGMMAIPGFFIGVPFAAAVRLLARSARERASSWAINGCASVVVSFASALIAPAAGARMLLAVAAAAYLASTLAICGPRSWRWR